MHPDVTDNCEPEQTKLPGMVNRPPETGPVEERPPQQKLQHPIGQSSANSRGGKVEDRRTLTRN